MAERHGRKVARDLVTRTGYGRVGGHLGRADGGETSEDVAADKARNKRAMRMHDDQMHGGSRTDLSELKHGGYAAGGTAPARSDRPARHSKGPGRGNKINILIAPHHGSPPGGDAGAGAGGPPAGPPPPPPPPGGGGPPPPPPPPGGMMGLPPGAAGLPPGLPPRPPGMKRGGRASAAEIRREAEEEGESFEEEKREHEGRKMGGGTKHMTAGAASGEGRLEKSKGLSY